MILIEPEQILDFAFSADDPLTKSSIRSLRIEAAQLRYIRPAFGDLMYRRMCAGQYEDLVFSFIKPALSHFIRHELIVELAVRAGDRGVVRPSSEESSQTTAATRSDKQDRSENVDQQTDRDQSTSRSVTDTTTRKTVDKDKSTRTTDDAGETFGTDKRTVTSTDTDRTTGTTTTMQEGDVSASLTTTQKDSSDQKTLTKQSSDTTQLQKNDARLTTLQESGERTQELTGSGSRTESGTLTDAQVSARVSTGRSTVQSENKGQGSSTRTSFRASTPAEWQLLARQALRDARTFLRYAVEYVEANRDQFPDYAPTSGLGSSGSRRCIGGIIL